MSFLITFHNWLPQPPTPSFMFSWRWHLRWQLGPFQGITVFLDILHVYRRYIGYQTSVCFYPGNLSFIIGGLSQEPRRVERKNYLSSLTQATPFVPVCVFIQDQKLLQSYIFYCYSQIQLWDEGGAPHGVTKENINQRFFFFFLPHCVTSGDLISLTGIEPMPLQEKCINVTTGLSGKPPKAARKIYS